MYAREQFLVPKSMAAIFLGGGRNSHCARGTFFALLAPFGVLATARVDCSMFLNLSNASNIVNPLCAVPRTPDNYYPEIRPATFQGRSRLFASFPDSTPQAKMGDPCCNPECRHLHQEVQELRQEVQELREELRRVKSVSYDMLKQRGAWQCAGRTHADFSLEFEEFFDHDVEDMLDCLKARSMDEDRARQFLCNSFQSVYDKCKEQVLERMKGVLSRVLSTGDSSFGTTETVSHEGLYDACRAYGLLLHASGVTGREDYDRASQEVCTGVLNDAAALVPESEFKKFTGSISQLAWNFLTTVPPLVCGQPDTTFCRECYQKEMKPLWKEEITDYKLVYYRPVLYRSYEGNVASKGLVGNASTVRESTDVQKVQGKDDACSEDIEPKQDRHTSSQCQLHVAGEEALRRYKPRAAAVPQNTGNAQVNSGGEVPTPTTDNTDDQRDRGVQKRTCPGPTDTFLPSNDLPWIRK